MEGLCRVAQATGRVPRRNSFGGPPIPRQYWRSCGLFQTWKFSVQFLTGLTCTGKKSFEQVRISTYHFYMQHIRAAINFLDLALERGRQSTRSSPESLFAKSFQKTDPDQPPSCLLKHAGAEEGLTA